MLAVPAPSIFSMPESVSVPSAPPVATTKWPAPSSVTIAAVIAAVYAAVSVPPPPTSVSAPPPPVRVLSPLLPVMTLAPLLPVPLMLALPVRVRFSTLAALFRSK